MPVDDAHLVGRARSGDADAYAELLRRHHARLIGVCRRTLRGHAAAADVGQEAALVAWLQLDRLRDPAQFGAWLAAIGHNVAVGWARQLARASERLEPDDALPALAGADLDDPAQRLLAREGAEELAAAICALPAGQRDAVV